MCVCVCTEQKQIVPEDQRSLKPDAKLILKTMGDRPKNPRDRFIYPQVLNLPLPQYLIYS